MINIRIVLMPHSPDEPPTQIVVDELGRVGSRGPLQPGPAARTVLVVPGADAVARWLALSARGEVQARAAALMLLEDQVAVEADSLHLAFGPPRADGQRLVVAVDADRMRGWLEAAALEGLKPDAVVPDHLTLPEPAEGEGMVAARFGGLVAARGFRRALACEPELLPVLTGDAPVKMIERGDELARRLAEAAERPAVNLLQGEFDPSRARRLGKRDWRLAAVLATAVVLSPLALMAAQTVRYDTVAKRLEARAERRVAGVLGKGAAVTDPLGQATARLAVLEIGAGGGPSGLIASLFSVVERVDQAQIESLVITSEGEMRAAVSYADHSNIEMLRDGLQRAGLGVRESAVREEAGRVVTDFVLMVRP